MLLDFKLSVLSFILSQVLFVAMSLESRRCAKLLAAFWALKALFKNAVYRNDPSGSRDRTLTLSHGHLAEQHGSPLQLRLRGV